MKSSAKNNRDTFLYMTACSFLVDSHDCELSREETCLAIKDVVNVIAIACKIYSPFQFYHAV